MGFEHALYFNHKKAAKRSWRLCNDRAATKRSGKKWVALAAAKAPSAGAGAGASWIAGVVAAAATAAAAAVAGCVIATRRQAQRSADEHQAVDTVSDAAAPMSPLIADSEKGEIDV